MIEILGFAVIGILAGTFTGLIPGIHVNNLTPILVSIALSTSMSPLHASSLIVAMMLTHTFLDFIPSTFLGVPNEETALSVLPAHQLVLDGRGYEVIQLTALGSLGALILSAFLAGLLIPAMKIIYTALEPHMHWLLLGIAITMFSLEDSLKGTAISAGIFLLSGFLGLITLNSNLVAGGGALVPLLSGMFGMSVLIVSLKSGRGPPDQNFSVRDLDISANVKPIFTGASAGFITGIMPGVGPAQGTVLSQAITDSEGTRNFLVGVSGVNTGKALLSFVTLYAIGKPRSGAAVAVNKIISIGSPELLSIVGIALFSGGIASVLHLKIGKFIAKNIDRLPYKEMCLTVIVCIVAFSFYTAGLWGILILVTATALGLLPPSLNVKRTHCMGCLMFPVMLYFAGLENHLLSIIGL